MEALSARRWWVGTCGSVLASTALFLSGCATLPIIEPAPAPKTAAASLPSAADEDWARLNAPPRPGPHREPRDRAQADDRADGDDQGRARPRVRRSRAGALRAAEGDAAA